MRMMTSILRLLRSCKDWSVVIRGAIWRAGSDATWLMWAGWNGTRIFANGITSQRTAPRLLSTPWLAGLHGIMRNSIRFTTFLRQRAMLLHYGILESSWLTTIRREC